MKAADIYCCAIADLADRFAIIARESAALPDCERRRCLMRMSVLFLGFGPFRRGRGRQGFACRMGERTGMH